jgi:Mce-associated membrane protein
MIGRWHRGGTAVEEQQIGPARLTDDLTDATTAETEQAPAEQFCADALRTEDGKSAEKRAAADPPGSEPESDGEPQAKSTTTARRFRFPRNIFRRNLARPRQLACGVLVAFALMLTMAAGWLKWQACSEDIDRAAGPQVVQAASDTAVAVLSYRPDTVEKDLGAASNRLTGTFRDAYTSLIHDVIIPGAKDKQISAVAKVPAAALVKVTGSHAVVLLAVDQTITVGNDPPSNTASSVRVTLDKVGSRWLISGFDPV